jgi:hypothetical protein
MFAIITLTHLLATVIGTIDWLINEIAERAMRID